VVSNYFSNYNIINVYSKKSIESKLVTQMLCGEKFKIISRYKEWWKIRLQNDGYKGYIIKRKFITKFKPTYKVSVLAANIYGKPFNKTKKKEKLTFSSRIRVKEKHGSFVKFENGWIRTKDIKPINYKDKSMFSKIDLFKGKKYKWGGKSYKGIDCSALVQLFLNQNNKFCPRDTKDQEKYFKKRIKLKNIKKNDMIFWKGHVAIALSKNKLIHAYGSMKKVVITNIKETIERINKTANLKVTSIRRI